MPVHGYTGLWGSGKTFVAVQAARAAALKYGVPVVSNLELRYPDPGLKTILVEDFEELMDYSDCVLLLDEIGILAPSRLYQKLKPRILVRWAQMRKYRIHEVFWTSQTLARVDTVIRELTWDVVEMTSFRRLGFFAGVRYVGALGVRQKVGVEFYGVRRRVFDWYDTMAVISGRHLE
ncbi:MAG: zonular occludens toxin domain-containing protein [Candidatus Nanopelagicales bacterium]